MNHKLIVTLLAAALIAGCKTANPIDSTGRVSVKSPDADEAWLSALDLSGVEQGWGEPGKDRSVDRRELSIGGMKFSRGVGTHAAGSMRIGFDGQPERFAASVGVDDEVGARGSVVFQVLADGKLVWQSGVMRGGEAAKEVSVDLKGVKQLELKVEDAGDDFNFDHADWADAKFYMISGKPRMETAPPEPAIVLTPKPSPQPRINNAKVFGVRPGHPFLFTIAATGERPMTFAAEGLPEGLKLDSQSGRITGVLKETGEHTVTLRARNALGPAEQKFRIRCGPNIGLTPAMGWNSWNCFASAVTAEHVKSAAEAMVKSGLINHGWTYINIDDFWQVHRESNDPTLNGPARDAQGRILPNPRFPDMKGLADYVHSLGLKVGLYSSPGPWTCGGCVGSFGYELRDAESYAAWGFDYLKYDWCSYNPVLETQRAEAAKDLGKFPSWGGVSPTDRAELARPYKVMQDALAQQPRDILYPGYFIVRFDFGKE